MNLCDFPTEVLEIIFSYGDQQSMIALSETSKLFNDIICESPTLTKKFTLNLSYPENCDAFIETMQRSRRRYRSIKIIKSRERSIENANLTPKQIFASISTTIQHLELNWASSNSRARENSLIEFVMSRRQGRQHLDDMFVPFERNVQQVHNQIRERVRNDSIQEFVSILREFKSLITMKWINVHLERHSTRPEPLPHLSSVHELMMKHCDAHCFEILMPCNQLKKFNFMDPFWGANRLPGIDSFEKFLISQVSLKDLSIKNIQYPRLFHVDSSSSIQFKLNSLVLKNVFFKDMINAENFFKTQNQLRVIKFQMQNEKVRSLDELLFYNNILSIVFTSNQSLHTVLIEKNKYAIENLDFLSNIPRNPSVQNLIFSVTAEDKSVDLFKNLIRMFPNLKNVTFKSDESEDTDSCRCFDNGTILDKTKSLAIINSSVRSLHNVYAENLENFEFAPGKTGEYIDDFIGGFLHRHRTIKRLVIGSKSRSNSYFFVSYNLCQLIVDFLHQLESISIFNFGEVNKSVKLLCTLRKLKTITLSSGQYQQFTAKTKVECERMKIKLIPVEVQMPQGEMIDISGGDYERAL